MNNLKLPAEVEINQLQILSNSHINLDQEFDIMDRSRGGRKRKMSLEMCKQAINYRIHYDHETWIGTYRSMVDHLDYSMPTYGNFMVSIKKIMKFLLFQIQRLLLINRLEFASQKDKISYVDSTPLPVCKLIRSSRHKTMSGVASYSKSTTGWYYGNKLHVACNYRNSKAIHLEFSTNAFHDRKFLAKIMQDKNLFYQSGTMFVADKGYQSIAMQELAITTGNYLLTGKRKSKKETTLASWFDIYLLHNRAKIETLFSNFKCNYFGDTTRARSVLGYILNYIVATFGLVSGLK